MRNQDFFNLPDPDFHDGLELWALVNLNDKTDEQTCFEPVTTKDVTPDMWTIFLHCRTGGIIELLDCLTQEEARKEADEIASHYGWEISDFIPQ